MTADLKDVTLSLGELDAGAPAVAHTLFSLLYAELRRIASARLRNESPGHTLSATALTHEAWFGLEAQTRTRGTSRAHFLAVASTLMRRILVDHARAKRADKRDAPMVTFSEAEMLLDVSGTLDVRKRSANPSF